MSSRLIVNSIRHTGASSDALTLDSSGNVTCNGTATGFGGGKILQVKSSAKTDVASTTSTSFTAISGLSVNITPSSASSKILITVDLKAGNAGAAYFLQLLRGSTPIYIGDTASGMTPCLQQSYGGSDTGQGLYGMDLMGGTFLDTPTYNLGDTLTYSLQFKRGDDYSVTLYVNRTSHEANDYVGRGASSITVMEVAA
tara:strand:- start:18 stop:611 length:594 start_codon:yes stop_codon:yes gene_type:complete